MIEWISLLISLFTLWIVVRHFYIGKRDKRIEDFVREFFRIFDRERIALKNLIPAGILNLENHKEIKLALEKIEKRIGFHPLRNWNRRIEEIGYFDFFTFVVSSNNILNKNSIDGLINDCKQKKEEL